MVVPPQLVLEVECQGLTQSEAWDQGEGRVRVRVWGKVRVRVRVGVRVRVRVGVRVRVSSEMN